MMNRLAKSVALLVLLTVGVGCFYLAAMGCLQLTADYSSEPVYEIAARQVQPEYEGKMVRLRGVVEEKLPGEGWRARLGAFEVCHGEGAMYTRQNHPRIGAEAFLLGRQSGDRLLVFHHFEGNALAWKLCSHKYVIYAGGIFSTWHKLLVVAGGYVLGLLCFWGARRCCRARGVRAWWAGVSALPLLLYLVELGRSGFAVDRFEEIISLQWAPVLAVAGALLLPLLLTLCPLLVRRMKNKVNEPSE